MQLKKEKRQRFLENLVKEAIINVLAEQGQQAPIPPPTTPPALTMNPTDADVQNPVSPEAPPTQEQPFSVDQMVDKLNVLRGSKSFKDPEVYGQLTTFFKGMSDEQKTTFDQLLTELNKIVVSSTPSGASPTQPMPQSSGKPPSGGGNAQNMGGGAPPPNAGSAPVNAGM
jgi:hypothetical protein